MQLSASAGSAYNQTGVAIGNSEYPSAHVMPPGWKNPIRVLPGQMQLGVDATMLLPSRCDLEQSRLDQQNMLRQTRAARFTPIQVGADGIIWDGHHAVRLAAEMGETVDVQIIAYSDPWSGLTILQLPVW